jgi:hypothetical protein
MYVSVVKSYVADGVNDELAVTAALNCAFPLNVAVLDAVNVDVVAGPPPANAVFQFVPSLNNVIILFAGIIKELVPLDAGPAKMPDGVDNVMLPDPALKNVCELPAYKVGFAIVNVYPLPVNSVNNPCVGAVCVPEDDALACVITEL